MVRLITGGNGGYFSIAGPVVVAVQELNRLGRVKAHGIPADFILLAGYPYFATVGAFKGKARLDYAKGAVAYINNGAGIAQAYAHQALVSKVLGNGYAPLIHAVIAGNVFQRFIGLALIGAVLNG